MTQRSTRLSAIVRALGGNPIKPIPHIPAMVNVGTLGSKVNADFAATIWDERRIPAGWDYLGSGVSRTVYQGPDNVAYKVDRVGNANSSEYAVYVALKDSMPSGVRLAECTVWSDTVNAMELVTTVGAHLPNNLQMEILRLTAGMGRYNQGIGDLHGQNVGQDADGTYVIIDYAQ